MKYAWMFVPVAAGALVLGGCLQPDQAAGPKKNELTRSAYSTYGWRQLPGTAQDIGASACPYVWKIDVGSGDRPIEYLDIREEYPTWTQIYPGVGKRVEVEDDGHVWIVNVAGDMWRGTQVGGFLTKYNTLTTGGTVLLYDVGAGGGQVWALGGTIDPLAGGMRIYRLNRTSMTWDLISNGLGKRISVDKDGNAWVVNWPGQVFRFSYPNWIQVGNMTNAYDIGVGYDGYVAVTDNNNNIYNWTGTTWLLSAMSGVEIDEGNGYNLVRNASNEIWTGN